MKLSDISNFLLAASLAGLGGCASQPPIAVPTVPASLRAPAGQTAFLAARASGVQIYDCKPKADAPSGFEWVFRAPEAALTDLDGHPIGKHYAGPTWESTDGSRVVGELRARDPGPNPSAIPWLLLARKSTTGMGVFGPTTSIQRLSTEGGTAPPQPCDSAGAGQVARVPYTATYYFYRESP